MKTETCYIVGICDSPNESGVALLANGELIFSGKEPLPTSKKASLLFPQNTLWDCLNYHQISIDDIDYIIGCKNKKKKKGLYSGPLLHNFDNLKQKMSMENKLRSALGLSPITEIPLLLCYYTTLSLSCITRHSDKIKIEPAVEAAYSLWYHLENTPHSKKILRC